MESPSVNVYYIPFPPSYHVFLFLVLSKLFGISIMTTDVTVQSTEKPEDEVKPEGELVST